MVKYILSLLFVSLSLSLSAQKLITIPNDSSFVTSVVVDEFELTDVHIYVKNNTPDSVTVTWQMLNYTGPSQWTLGLCDNFNCYDMLLNPGPYESLYILAGDTMDMKFQFAAHCVA